jgi:hypothetical protein
MKKLNTDSITNELVHSSFFPGRPAQREEEAARTPAPQLAPVETVRPVITKAVVPPTPKTVRKLPSVPAVPTSAPAGRRYIRRTFDFFEDQIAYLTKASLEERLAGGEGSMNAMVREAIDAFIEKNRKK